MKETAMRIKFALIVGTALVAVLVFSSVALASGPFAVTKTMPNSGATGIAPTANVKAFFNHDIKASTVTATTFKIRKQGTTTWLGAARSVNNTISPTSTNGGSQSMATLNPSEDLASNMTYQVVVVGGSSGVKDVTGKALSTNKSWTFTTAGTGTSPDTTAPTVASYEPCPWPCPTPADVSTNVTATFSEAMDPKTLITTPIDPANPNVGTSTTFTLTKSGESTPVAAQVTYDPASKKAILNPDSNLADSSSGSSYTAVIKGGSDGVKDLAGNSLAQDFIWTFQPCNPGHVFSPQSIEPKISATCG
jgi:hypothetical protein